MMATWMAALVLASTLSGTPTPAPAPEKKPSEAKPRMYTTYFYTAAEAVVHGYEANTQVRIVSLSKPGTVWEGTVGVGETQTVRTGQGAFGFLSDKKASILVGTPSSCAVVGYFLKDEQGAYRSERFFTQLPSGTYSDDERVIVWAYEPAEVEVFDRRTEKKIAGAKLAAGGHLELPRSELAGNRVLEFRAKGSKVAVQVYYDQGFIAPASTGRGSGREFLVYVGSLTAGSNDLNVVSQLGDAKVTVTDVKTQKPLWSGVVKRGGLKTLNLSRKYVRVESDTPVNVVVAAYDSLASGYAEHHFGTGVEGSGIENDFLLTTSGEVWMFSYYADNPVTVTDARNGKKVFEGVLNAGAVRGLTPGGGLFRIKSHMGISVMGGASTCGADYSPAAGMFAVDDAMYEVIAQVKAERAKVAAARGQTLTEAAAAAPMTDDEWKRHGQRARDANTQSMTANEANQRAAAIQSAQ